jgi:hypothetical protein
VSHLVRLLSALADVAATLLVANLAGACVGLLVMIGFGPAAGSVAASLTAFLTFVALL